MLKNSDSSLNFDNQIVEEAFILAWKSFYDLKRSHALLKLRNLSRPPNNQVAPGPIDHLYGRSEKYIDLDSVSCIHLNPIPPNAAYTSVAYVTRSIFHGDDSDCMAFIPYEDDVNFDSEKHAKAWYSDFAWQKKERDPDRTFDCLNRTKDRLVIMHAVQVIKLMMAQKMLEKYDIKTLPKVDMSAVHGFILAAKSILSNR